MKNVLSAVGRAWFGVALWKRILAALLLGAVAGLVAGDAITWISPLGELFMRLIRMVVAPLVFFTIASGVAGLGDPGRLGRVGGRLLLLLLGMTTLSVALGLLVGALVEPGQGAALAGAAPREIGPAKGVAEQLLAIVPVNPIKALADGDILAVIFFSGLIGVALLLSGEAGEPAAAVLRSGTSVLLLLVRLIMEAAPFGVFALVAVVVGTNGLKVFVSLSLLAGCLAFGTLLQVLILQPLLVRLLSGLSAVGFLRNITDAVLMAFSTVSSLATLPVTITVAQRNLGIQPALASALLPLGVNLGRDGTAFYVALLATFAAQAFGVPLGAEEYALLWLAGVLLALGATGVPSASLFILAGLLSVIGVSDAHTALLVGFILPFDRILDMMRTVPNVTANLAATTIVARAEGELDPEIYAGRAD